jgi:hypothetical protein
VEKVGGAMNISAIVFDTLGALRNLRAAGRKAFLCLHIIWLAI